MLSRHFDFGLGWLILRVTLCKGPNEFLCVSLWVLWQIIFIKFRFSEKKFPPPPLQIYIFLQSRCWDSAWEVPNGALMYRAMHLFWKFTEFFCLRNNFPQFYKHTIVLESSSRSTYLHLWATVLKCEAF